MRVKFDPKVVQLTNVVAGGLLTADGQSLLPLSKNVMNDTGDASITLSRLPGAGGIGGAGTLVTFTFQAVGKGSSSVAVQDLALRNSKLEQIGNFSPEATITVK